MVSIVSLKYKTHQANNKLRLLLEQPQPQSSRPNRQQHRSSSSSSFLVINVISSRQNKEKQLSTLSLTPQPHQSHRALASSSLFGQGCSFSCVSSCLVVGCRLKVPFRPFITANAHLGTKNINGTWSLCSFVLLSFLFVNIDLFFFFFVS